MFNVVSVLATMDIPKEILPVSAVSRGAHGFFTDDPLFTVAVRFACIPLNVFCHFLREDDSDKYMGCFLVVVNEVIACICMAITLLEVDSALCKQEQAAMDLEKQIQKRELDMKENEKVVLGARRLLSVTCDCCERLSHDWQIVGPSQSTLGLLQVRDPVMSRLPFLQFICPEDHQRFTDFAEVSHTTDAPSSLHVRMQRSDSSHFEAQIFLVNLPGTSIGEGRPEYLIGLAASDPSERLQGINMMSIPENSPLVPHVRKRKASSSCRSSVSGSSSRKSQVDQVATLDAASALGKVLEDIDHISLFIDLQTGAEGYCIRSAQFHFNEEAPLDTLPKLYTWVRQRHQPTVEDWIQEHVNLWYSGQTSDETCRGIKCQLPSTEAKFVVGELSAGGFLCKGLEENPGADYSLVMKINFRQFLPA